MTTRAVRPLLVTLVLAALAMFCLSDLAQATAPTTESGECASRLCDDVGGCGTTPSKPVAPVVTAVVAPVVVASPALSSVLAFAPEPLARSDRQVVPLAPRSPPFA
jgi:hypothetical protein